MGGQGSGRKLAATYIPPGSVMRTTTERKLIVPKSGINLMESRYKGALAGHGRMDMEGYASACWKLPSTEQLSIFKLTQGVEVKKADLLRDEPPTPEELERYIFEAMGPGKYLLCPRVAGNFPHRSRVYTIGDVELARGADDEGDLDTLIARRAKRLSDLATVREWKRLDQDEEDGDGMKIEQLGALLTAIKPDLTPFLEVVRAQGEMMRMQMESERARADRLQAALDHKLDREATAQQGIWPEVIRAVSAKPEILELLKPPEEGWSPTTVFAGIGKMLELAGPMLQPLVQQLHERMAGMTGVAPNGGVIVSEPARTRINPAPIHQEEGEEEMAPAKVPEFLAVALGMVIPWLRERDFASVEATMASTPGLNTLLQQIGDGCQAMVDRGLPNPPKPQAYLPFFMGVLGADFPPLVEMLVEFIAYVQEGQIALIKKGMAEEPQGDGA